MRVSEIARRGLAWVAPGIILLAGLGAKPGVAFRAGYFAGLAFFTSLYWLLLIPVRYAPIVGWLAVSLVLSFYPALWLWFAWRVFPARFENAEPGWSGLLARFVETTWGALRWCLTVAAALVAWEMAQARAVQRVSMEPPRCIAIPSPAADPDRVGDGRVRRVIHRHVVLGGAARRVCAIVERSRPAQVERRIIRAGARSCRRGGAWRSRSGSGPPRASRTLRMALVQPAIPQEVVWDQSYEKKAARFASLLALSEAAVTNNPTVVVWPEAALPDLLRWSTNQYNGRTVLDAVTGFARRHKVWMVIGADDAELTPGTRDEVSFYNSSFLINPAGNLVSSYRKRRLVMFGEYVPLSEWFPFLKRLAHVQGEFTPGTDVVTFDMAGLDVQTSVLICFEDVFPHITREHVKDDTDFLLNLTNNGWFGESAAQWQHAANAVFRAIENGLPRWCAAPTTA